NDAFRRRFFVAKGDEQILLARPAVGLGVGGGLESAREYVHELRPLGANEAVERSGFDQFFNGGTRDDLHVDAIAEVEQISKRSRFTPGPHDFLSGAAADAFYGGQ